MQLRIYQSKPKLSGDVQPSNFSLALRLLERIYYIEEAQSKGKTMKKASGNRRFTQEFFIFLALLFGGGLLPFVTPSTSANSGFVKLWVG